MDGASLNHHLLARLFFLSFTVITVIAQAFGIINSIGMTTLENGLSLDKVIVTNNAHSTSTMFGLRVRTFVYLFFVLFLPVLVFLLGCIIFRAAFRGCLSFWIRIAGLGLGLRSFLESAVFLLFDSLFQKVNWDLLSIVSEVKLQFMSITFLAILVSRIFLIVFVIRSYIFLGFCLIFEILFICREIFLRRLSHKMRVFLLIYNIFNFLSLLIRTF